MVSNMQVFSFNLLHLLVMKSISLLFRALARRTLAGNLLDSSIYTAVKWKRGTLRLTWHPLGYWWEYNFLKYSEKHENTGALLMHIANCRRLTH